MIIDLDNDDLLQDAVDQLNTELLRLNNHFRYFWSRGNGSSIEQSSYFLWRSDHVAGPSPDFPQTANLSQYGSYKNLLAYIGDYVCFLREKEVKPCR